MKKCPKCGGNEFKVNAHVVQTWLLDENGDFIECVKDDVAVAHFPDNNDLWTCKKCSYKSTGNNFEN